MIIELCHLTGGLQDLHPSSVTLLSVLPLGFFLGMRHATDPDHVATVTNFVVRKNSIRGAVSIGSIWGLGHTLSILAVGSVLVFCRYAIPPQIAFSLELLVAVMLIVLGVLNLDSFVRWVRSTLPRPAAALLGDSAFLSGERHDHPRADRTETDCGKTGWPLLARPLFVGVVHGLAGSAALTLIVIPILQDPPLAIGYLLMFGVGSLAGMAVITAAIALPCARLARNSVLARRRLSTGAGILSIAFGILLVWEMTTRGNPLIH